MQAGRICVFKKNEEKGGEIGGRIKETQNAGLGWEKRQRESEERGEDKRRTERGEMKKKVEGERKKGGRERN